MRMYGRAEEAVDLVLAKFKNGDIPEALAQRFLTKTGSAPSDAWSWNNQIIMILSGTHDARGFKQWLEAGRKVKKGAKSFAILAPIKKKITRQDKETGEEKSLSFIYGFKHVCVFSIEDTEIFDEDLWVKANTMGKDTARFLEELPLKEVAEVWGLRIMPVPRNGRSLGSYSPGKGTIRLATQNLSTWAHELVHAADDKCGNLVKAFGQESSNEIVAELGGAAILTMLGYKAEADLGGAWRYIQDYGGQDKNRTIQMCMNLLDRTCQAIELIVDAASQTQQLNAA